MSKVQRTCPHCFTKNVSLNAFAEVMKPRSDRVFVTAFHCENCYGGYFIEIQCHSSETAISVKGNIEDHPYCDVKREYPIPDGKSSPDYLPENIDNFFMQAVRSLESKSFDASSIMSRKVLEASVKTIDPNGTGNLFSRIERLASGGKITNELKDWAHLIREDGNDAAHEEGPTTEAFAKELLAFAEMFIMYVFTMPGMVSEKRSRVSA
jgi:hypothetical protein